MTSKCQIEIDHRPRSSGYNVKLFINSKAAEKYICTICKSVLKHAVQIPESVDPKRACQDCYQENIRNGVCPLFGTHNTLSYPDKFADREIWELLVVCENKENGCNWTDRLKQFETHIVNCDYRGIKCEHCQQVVVLMQHQDHCPNIPIKCSACSMVILRKNMEDHNLHCEMQYQICECGERILANELPTKLLAHWQHQQGCLYSYIGCELDRSTYHNENHEALIVSHIVKLKQSNITLAHNNDEKDIKIELLEKQINQLKEQNVVLTKSMDGVSSNLKIVSDTVQVLKKEVEILKDGPSQLQIPVLGAGGKLKRDIEEMKSKVSGMNDRSQDLSKSVADMDLKIQLQENKTLNGELIWKIDKVDLRMAQARSGNVVVLHSAPCYTKQYEYKYCSRLYLQGDGMGRSTHVSLFFVVMKSEYDQLLNWPMQKRITFELINHVNEAESVIESFISNPRSSSFQRPTNNMNVASGCPMFIALEKFLSGGFIVDNCAYIKTTVQDVN